MFTGLVQRRGRITAVDRTGEGARLAVACTFDGLELGESIAVDGTCLTVTSRIDAGFTCDASSETLARTTLGERRVGAGVHLERALRLGDRLGGHLVTGHVDGVGRMVERHPLGDSVRVVFEAPAELAPLIAPKGSVTVDGVSLTVNGVEGQRFDVVLVPFTRRETTFDERSVGAPVNLETDVLAKYVARLLGRPGVGGGDGGGGVTLDLLARQGYL